MAVDLWDHGLTVHIQDELPDIPRQLSDIEWASAVARRNWVAITRDKRIQYRSAEKQAIADAGLALFVLSSHGNLSRQEIVDSIAAAAPRIASFLERNPPPFIATIRRDGGISLKEAL